MCDFKTEEINFTPFIFYSHISEVPHLFTATVFKFLLTAEHVYLEKCCVKFQISMETLGPLELTGCTCVDRFACCALQACEARWPLPCPSGTRPRMPVKWCFPPLCSWFSSLFGFVEAAPHRCCPASAYGRVSHELSCTWRKALLLLLELLKILSVYSAEFLTSFFPCFLQSGSRLWSR